MKRHTIEYLLRFPVRHFTPIFLITLLVTCVFGFLTLRLKVNADVESLISDGGQTEGFSDKAFLNSDYLMIAVEGDDLYNVQTMKQLSPYLNEIAGLANIGTPITPFNQFTFEQSGSRLKLVRFSPTGKAPETDEDMELFKTRILADEVVRGLLVSADGRVLCFLYPYSPMDDYAAFMDKLDPILLGMNRITPVHVSGPIPFEKAIRDRLLGDFSRLILLSLAVILVLLYFGFRSVRITIMPILIVVIGTIWTLGLMSLFHIPLSVISIMTPPLVLTLGTSYTIHLLNQYIRDASSFDGSGLSITESVFSIGRTIVLASATTIIGFSSLLATRLEQTRDFGMATSFGILSCAVLSIFLLPGLLSKMKKPSKDQYTLITAGGLVRFLDKAGSFTQRRRVWFLALMATIPIIFLFSLNSINYDSNYLGYFPKKDKVVRDFYFIAENLSGIDQIQITLQGPSDQAGFFLQPEILRNVALFEDTLKQEESITYLVSFPSYIREMNRVVAGAYEIPPTRGLILLLSRYFTTLAKEEDSQSMLGVMANDDFTRIVCTFRTFDKKNHTFASEEEIKGIVTRAEASAGEILPSDITVSFSGGSLRYKDLYERTRQDQLRSMILALVLIFLITSVFFRSFLYGVLSLLPMTTGISAMYIFMAITAIPLDMTTLMVSSVAIGIGVDDSIHFLLQYRKQRSLPEVDNPIRTTLHITGRPIVLTSVSIMGGILVLSLSSFKPIYYFSVLVSFTLFATTLGCIFLLPAVLSVLHGRRTVKP